MLVLTGTAIGGYFFTSFLVNLFPIPLKTIFTFTLTDKEAPGKHHYGWAYDRNFRKFKYKRIKILEIGIGGYEFSLGGQSLNAWQSYFPFARIVAADIKDKTRLRNFRTNIHIVDQGDKASLLRLAEQEGAFDIIIDDGSHWNSHQLLTFDTLFDFVRDGGIYVIEDVQTSYWPTKGWDGAPPESKEFDSTCVGYFLRVAKYINHREMMTSDYVTDANLTRLASKIKALEFHHNLVFIHKGKNDDPSNVL